MLIGTVVENSLCEPKVVNDYSVIKTRKVVNWTLHTIKISKAKAIEFAQHLKEGPWYAHFWDENQDDILVVFKDKRFETKHSDKTTWQEAVEYGVSIGIPEAQLDFVIE